MAIVSNPLIGKTKQSAGGVTFTSWKGRNVLKNKATSVANPQTPLQMANRNRLSGSTKFYAKHRSALMMPFLRMMGDVTDGNKFVSLNRLCFYDTGVGLDVSKIADLNLSMGSLGTFVSGALVEDGATHAKIEYDYLPNAMQAEGSDVAAIVIYNESADQFYIFQGATTAGVNVKSIGVPADAGEIIHGWVYSYSISGRKLSNSFYCGSYTAS